MTCRLERPTSPCCGPPEPHVHKGTTGQSLFSSNHCQTSNNSFWSVHHPSLFFNQVNSMNEIQMELDVFFIAWFSPAFTHSCIWYVFNSSAIKEPIYMNIFKNERMKRGGTCRLSTDLVQSCSSADVTWAWVGGSSSSSLSMWKYSNSRSWSGARN